MKSLFRNRSRRGVILLVAMSMLALFMMVVVTFVLVARQHKQSSIAAQRHKHYDPAYEDHLNEAMLQIVRGTTNPRSVIGPHSFLEDLYGSDGITGTLTASGGIAQMLQLDMADAGTTSSVTGAAATISIYDGYYAGCVITMLNGPCRMQSSRIVQYIYNGATGPGRMRVLPFVAGTPAVGNRFLINGRALNGTGFGWNATAGTGSVSMGLLNADSGGLEFALTPNAAYFTANGLQQYTDMAGLGGADEGYDAADEQNMLLAARVWNGANWEVGIPSLHRPALVNYWLASRGATGNATTLRKVLLRPLPLDHPSFPSNNKNWNTSDDINGDGVLNIGPATWETAGAAMLWDVDNDGDGRPDSVWADFGFPVETAPDGRRYKPMIAILCLDLDSRLNLNVHGNVNHNTLVYPTPPVPPPVPTPYPGTLPIAMPYGMGYGPGEVYLKELFAMPAPFFQSPTTLTEFNQLLLGVLGTRRNGRYGELAFPPPAAPPAPWPRPGVTGLQDPAALARNPDYPTNFPTTPSSYGSPGDLDGDGRTALDHRGNPVTSVANLVGEITNNELLDNAYDMNVAPNARHVIAAGRHKDYPFSPGELEYLLRFYDVDIRGLPPRLVQLCPNVFAAIATPPLPPASVAAAATTARYNRGLVTTDSWNIPVPNVTPTRDMLIGADNDAAVTADNFQTLMARPPINLSTADLLAYRLQAGRTPIGGATTLAINTQLRTQLATDLLLGMRMDLNRPFGNHADNNGNQIVDDPAESVAGETVSWQGGAPPFDHNRDGVVSALDARQRYEYAKHLYVLMMMLKDGGYVHPTPLFGDAGGGLTAVQRNHLTAKRIAQWAVNVVDFRDPDMIMTGFEYDQEPFDNAGWEVDGDLAMPFEVTPDRQVVWGCEEPVLLLTETSATHDRRVENLPIGGDRTVDGDPDPLVTTPEDATMDQGRIPQGSAFIELYCTRNPNNPAPAPELFAPAGAGLDLGRMAVNDPVWRMVISDPDVNVPERLAGVPATSRPYSTSLQPDPPLPTLPATGFNMLTPAPGGAATVRYERVVWFTRTAPGAGHPDFARTYYNREPGGPTVLLQPGQYAVVGPARSTAPGSPRATQNVTKFGTPAAAPASQEVQLSPAASYNITDNGGGPDMKSYPYPAGTTRARVTIPCGATRNDPTIPWPAQANPIGLNISEPIFSAPGAGYYPPPDAPTIEPVGGMIFFDAYLPARDTPFDSSGPLSLPAPGLPAAWGHLRTGTYQNYRGVFLQRLANPLVAFNAITNPYITVDWMSIDLTVFNGQSDPATDPDDNPLTMPLDGHDPEDPLRGEQATGSAYDVHFATRQRGTPRTPAPAGSSRFNLWWAVSDNPPDTDPVAVAPPNFQHRLDHTLGFLNEPFHDSTGVFGPNRWRTTPTAPITYQGDPWKPFPWLTWNNRPFINPYELMNVPASSPARLTWEYSLGGGTTNHYLDVNAPATNPQPPHSHLLNFFHSTNYGPGAAQASNYHRIFDFVCVHSRFAGVDQILDNTVFRAGTPGLNAQMNALTNAAPFPATPVPFCAPFNYVSRFREPGRINLNTVFDINPANMYSPTLHAMLNHMQDFDRSWDNAANATVDDGYLLAGNLVRSRKGYGNTTNVLQFNSGPPAFTVSPTFFANPFRPTQSNYHVPLDALRKQGLVVGGTELEHVETGFMRRSVPNPAAVVAPDPLARDLNRPLFADDSWSPGPGGVWGAPPNLDQRSSAGLGAGNNDSNRQYASVDQNPYFRYQALGRLGNLATTHSNVYAIWVTVGYFEVTMWDPDGNGVPNIDAGHPDGLQLGRELNTDNGEIKRHRAFYMLDRTIPMAFERGQNHNVHNGLLIQRIIE